ncbi:serine/threonine protein kinase [Shewanella sp. SG44-2]|uniref:serine/threonine protein kinase n=1 Tax=Shewanella sp. SG44-2 TaxID=2760962 RepID=UPI001600D02B|nr:serine/threonine-protein kinase [Shewanella sp. SG44-2]MBB1425655.1 serine/threonine protein kinase [Shewanella sp. SG44-2]
MDSTALFDHFSRLIDLPQSQHAAYFAEHITDGSLANKLTPMLASHFSANDKTQWHELIAQQAQHITGDEQLERLLGTHLGVYTLSQIIGEGGMGIVFLAERNDGMMQQQVAIKFLFPSIVHVVGSQLVHNQAQILARLNHPNITQVYDAGTTESGLHYVVMEYVAGLPIDAYCRAHQLNFIERIYLFLDVCDAISKTHLINIAHSDIKPANILVNKDGVVKILDFDIAKTLQHNEQESQQDSVKRYLRALSLAYASPEQLTGQTLTLATDQYSLAVLLYMLLSEQLPFDIEHKHIGQLVCDIQAGAATPLSINPNVVSITRLQQWAMVDDLRRIIAKAMSAQASERYSTVAAFKSDIHKTLKHFASSVNFSPLQRGKKWLVRKPLLAAVYVMVIGAGISFKLQNEQVLQERNRAIAAQQKAEQEQVNATEVANQLANIFKQADPTQTQAKELTAKDMLAQGYESILASTTLSSSAKLALLQVIAESYTGQGQHQDAITVLTGIINTPEYLLYDIQHQLRLSLQLIDSYQRTKQNVKALAFVDTLKQHISAQAGSDHINKLTLMAELASIYSLRWTQGAEGLTRAKQIIDNIDKALARNTLRLTTKERISFLSQKISLLDASLLTASQEPEAIDEQHHHDTLSNIVLIAQELLPLIPVHDKQYIEVLKWYTRAITSSHMTEAQLTSEILMQALPDIIHFYGAQHPYIATVYNGLSRAFEHEGNLASAKIYRNRQLDLITLHHGADSFNYGEKLESLSFVYELGGEMAQADKLLLQGYHIAKQQFYQAGAINIEYMDNYINFVLYMIYHYANTERVQATKPYVDELHSLLTHNNATVSLNLNIYKEFQPLAMMLINKDYTNIIKQLAPQEDKLLDTASYLITAYVNTEQYQRAITLAERIKRIVLSGYAFLYPTYYYQQVGFDLAKAYGKSGDNNNAKRTLQEMYDYNAKLNPAADNYWLQRILRDAKRYAVEINTASTEHELMAETD